MYMTFKGFKIKNFGFQQQSECFGLIYTVNPTNISTSMSVQHDDPIN